MSPAADIRSILSTDQDKPVAWQYSIAVLLGMVFGGGFGLLLDQTVGGGTLALSLLTGMFLGLLTVMGPFFMALRLVLTTGLLMILVAALGIAAAGRPWLAVVGMVFLVFVATVWTALPIVGPLLGTFPTIIYLLLLAKGSALAGSADEGRAMLAAAAGVAGALVTLLLLSGRDARKQTRRVAAGAWSSDVTWERLGTILLVLRLDAAPKSLLSLTQAGIIAMISRGWLTDERDSAAYQAGEDAQRAIAGTLLPRGPAVPRVVTPPVDDALAALAAERDAATRPQQRYAWSRWRAAIEYAVRMLAGQERPLVLPFSSSSLTKAVVRSVLRPQSASFRYGVQRALALGVATFVMISTTIPQSYWFLLALFSIMQTNAGATVARAVQYAFGTWLGAVGAVAASYVLPAPVMAVLAAGVLVVGFAWMTRNFTIMAAAMAGAVVLLTGLPDGQFLQWAALRALDITAAAVVAVAVSMVILRVRPEPAQHVAAARQALLDIVADLRQRLTEPSHEQSVPTLQRESAFLLQMTNLESDMSMMKDPAPVQRQVESLQDDNNRAIALATVIYSGELDHDRGSDETAAIDAVLDKLAERLRTDPQEEDSANPAP